MEIFGRSRRQLTLTYTLMMCIMLVVLIFFVHKTMEWSMLSEQERELFDAVDNIADMRERDRYDEEGRSYPSYNDRLFFYVFDEDKRLIDFSRASFKVESFVLENIRTWNAANGEAVVLTRPSEFGRTTSIMMTAQIINAGGIGHTIYVGKDVSAMYAGLQKFTYVLIVLGVISLLVAVGIGHIMSGRAIVPLKIAYEKQKQFAADASHELRTPLSVVMASADLLLADQSITSPFLKQVIEDVKSEVKKMSALVSDLLIVARSDNNALKVQIKRFDLGALLLQNARMMRPLAQKKDIELEAENIYKVEITGDEQKIKQLILILVDNAIKYTLKNGLVIVRLEGVEDDHVMFSVEDSGIGIAPEDQDKVFERFYRVDKTRSREMGGNGLGLSIAYEIVKLHEGKISVESELGKGTKFLVDLKRSIRPKN